MRAACESAAGEEDVAMALIADRPTEMGLHSLATALWALLLEKASADINLRYSLHVKISILALRRFLKRHELYSEEADTDVEGNNVYKATWEEPAEAYEGASVRVEITVDQGHARLSTLTLKYNRRSGTLSVQEVQERFFGELVVAGVILDASGARRSVQNVFHPPLARFQHTILYDRVGPFLSTDR